MYYPNSTKNISLNEYKLRTEIDMLPGDENFTCIIVGYKNYYTSIKYQRIDLFYTPINIC